MDKITELILLEKIGEEELGNGFYIDSSEFFQLYEEKGSVENILDYFINEFKEKLKEPNLEPEHIQDLNDCIFSYPIIKARFIHERSQLEK